MDLDKLNKQKILDDINFCLEGEYITREHYEAIQGLMKMYKELEEYKKISELTKISCCTAQNCEALNNAIREVLENQKLRDKLEESESRLQEEINETCKLKTELYGNSISKDKIRQRIKELEEFRDENEKTKFILSLSFYNSIDNEIYDLKELLEEE